MRIFARIVAALSVLSLISFAIALSVGGNKPNVVAAAAVDTNVTVTVPDSGPDRKVIVDAAQKAIEDAGFEDGTYTVDEVDPSLDTATAASGKFSDERIQTPAQAVAFLKSGTDQAEVALEEAMTQTGAQKFQLWNEINWVCTQFTGTSVVWEGNTYYMDGAVQPGDARVDEAGAVACMFIPPYQVRDGHVTSIFVLRGACVNPQRAFPTPPCIKPDRPSGSGKYVYDKITCAWHKPAQSFDEQQNQSAAHQPVQDNTTSTNNGANSGSTPGAGSAPKPNPVYTAPTTPAPAPQPTPGGYDSGGNTAGSAPGGTTTSGGTTTTTGDPTNGAVDTGQGGNNGVTTGGSSTGTGTIADPDA